MAKNLVIVESPAKAKTIKKYLGKDFEVSSSFGHVRDLPKKGMSIDIENNFAPDYAVTDDKKKVVRELKKASKAADTVWLAADEDREGEAIAWHLTEVLDLKPANTKRIVFHEITKSAVLHAVENPRELDTNLVDAQQARRILDRIVGYELSPVLWRKVRGGLSAGRVQSVAVRLVVDKEQDVKDHEANASFKVVGEFTNDADHSFNAELKSPVKDLKSAEKLLNELTEADFTVSDLQSKPGKRSPSPPFTTSTLQQTASSNIGFSPRQSMRLAQGLYEAGHITYMRTDSLNLSQTAIAQAKDVITGAYGPEYHESRGFKTKSAGAQEAHEAIRPTDLSRVKAGKDAREQKLYNLIRNRALASQMASAKVAKTVASITASNDALFIAKGEIVTFPGFLAVYGDKFIAKDEKILPELKTGQKVSEQTITATEQFSRAPARYTEASLIKKLEELGIGRPSTFAPTISTIQDREYVVRGESEGEPRDLQVVTLTKNKVKTTTKTENHGSNKGKLIPTDVGVIVTDFLVKHLPAVVDFDFTAKVEAQFDLIAEGKESWQDMLKDFYGPFHKSVEEGENVSREEAVHTRVLGEDPKSGKPVQARLGRYGPMIQIGTKDDEDKPRFAPLPEGATLDNVTYEQAMKMFELPRIVGKTAEGEEIGANFGRFGPYVKFGSAYVSIKPDDPFTITLERALELIEEKKEADKNKYIHEFDSGLQVINGRYGPYITDGKKNAKIPKDVEPKDLTEVQCQELIDKAPAKRARGRRKKK